MFRQRTPQTFNLAWSTRHLHYEQCRWPLNVHRVSNFRPTFTDSGNNFHGISMLLGTSSGLRRFAKQQLRHAAAWYSTLYEMYVNIRCWLSTFIIKYWNIMWPRIAELFIKFLRVTRFSNPHRSMMNLNTRSDLYI